MQTVPVCQTKNALTENVECRFASVFVRSYKSGWRSNTDAVYLPEIPVRVKCYIYTKARGLKNEYLSRKLWPGEYGCETDEECSARCTNTYCEKKTDKNVGQCQCKDGMLLYGRCCKLKPLLRVQRLLRVLSLYF